MDVFVARQPIFDRQRRLHAYELLSCSDFGESGPDNGDAGASAKLIANSLLSIGLDGIVGDRKAFLKFDRSLLVGGLHSILPPETLVVELVRSVQPDDEVLAACHNLRKDGYEIALDGMGPDPSVEPLLHVAGVIKIDTKALEKPEQRRVLENYRRPGLAIAAENVDTETEFEWAWRAGYDLFQGQFFARPNIVQGRQIPAAKVACIRLLSELQNESLDFDRLKNLISRDVALPYKLLRYVNSALLHGRAEIHSIEGALAALGEEGIRRWIPLATLPEMSKDRPGELVTHSLVRASFCERIAQLAGVPDPNRAFLMGLFSMLDALVGAPLDRVLLEVGVDAAIRGALLGTAAEHDRLLDLYKSVRSYEAGDWPAVAALARALGVDPPSLAIAYSDSTLWAQHVLRLTGRRANTRREVRHGIKAAARILWEDEHGQECVSNAKLLNASVSGLQLEMDQRLPVRSFIFCNEPKLGICGTGSVRYCVFSKGKYLVGLEFGSGSGWSEPLQ
jgi:c-di-GMP-related signal transduction protein